ncbi:group II intron reverse transcriptase/maturase [Alkaliphilus sp. B6464]|uniref:group II intron reverse transcriptase/maturase n=1 Tax=Alkaliphilus sp. B6464 TaxID=2731219 RepID=UPI0020116874|nr:group II intron reverse transcriptase/maturase [Alkaliphilus sp. B6464]
MKDSIDIQRQQKTSYEDSSAKNKLETKGMHGVPSISVASTNETSSAASDNLMERILSRDNMLSALKRVEKNKGSYGVDRMKADELRPFLKQNWLSIKDSISKGRYKPSAVRRVEIPKPDGGMRLLGIPTVLDRLIQQAIAQTLTNIFDPYFSNNSFGFRPGRSGHDAVKQAKEYMNQGYKYAIDMDPDKFFDKVNNDILMHRVSKKIKDKRVLKLIRLYLQSGIMLNGIVVRSEEGTPQGGPLSPLLANILLDDLDKELEKRGHKFCRYADDCNIFVKSKRAGQRVMDSVTNFLENKLKLKVNKEKSAVDKPTRRKFLGFSFYNLWGKYNIRIHDKSIKRFKDKVRKITSRSHSISIEDRIRRLNQITTGWVNYFSIAKAKGIMQELDEWIRRRLRMCIWKQWKKPRTKIKNLISLGVLKYKAYEWGNTRKGYWRIANSPILSRSLTNKYLESISYQSLSARYQKMQLT